MATYRNSDELYSSLKLLFTRIQDQGPGATQSVTKAHMIIRLSCSGPSAEVTINGRQNPVQVTYGGGAQGGATGAAVRPDLDVTLTADALHSILLAELPLRRALASGQMKVRGPIWKTPALEDILHRGQSLYPQVLRDQGLNGFKK